MTPSNTTSRADSITIGALSQLTGVNIETIRYYEKIALLPPALRSQGRQRQIDVLVRQQLFSGGGTPPI